MNNVSTVSAVSGESAVSNVSVVSNIRVSLRLLGHFREFSFTSTEESIFCPFPTRTA